MRKITPTSRAAARRVLKAKHRQIHGPGPTITGGPNAQKLVLVPNPGSTPRIGDDERATLLTKPVGELMRFTPRALQGLREKGILTVKDLTDQTPRGLYSVTGVAKATIEKIIEALATKGLELREDKNAAPRASSNRRVAA